MPLNCCCFDALGCVDKPKYVLQAHMQAQSQRSIAHKRRTKGHFSLIFFTSHALKGFNGYATRGSNLSVGVTQSNGKRIVANPVHNPEDENSEEFLIVPLFDTQGNQNYPLEEILEIADYGYPTYEKAINMFLGGTFSSPEIILNDPLVIGFILNTLCLNGQLIKEQFEII